MLYYKLSVPYRFKGSTTVCNRLTALTCIVIIPQFKPQNKNIIKCNTLASREVNDWNALSTNTVLAPTLNIFKSRLEDEWKDKPWKYDPDNFY